MQESGRAREGYLVLADITGYTKYLAGTELEHAQGIIGELASLIMTCLAPPLRYVKTEGDAVFCCADGSALRDGERLLELIEVCYLEFSKRVQQMSRATTCSCDACTSIQTLDLKFVSHYGAYVGQRIGGMDDVAGPDVILAHRLLKNTIEARAYAFFTDACLARMPRPLHLPRHSESYESLGDVSGGVHDLRPVLEGRRLAAEHRVAAAEADFEVTFSVAAPPAVVWQYFDPERLTQWFEGLAGVDVAPNAQDRFGAGAEAHCDHGSWRAMHRYTDWRPFRHFTAVVTPTKLSLMAAPACTETWEFVEQPDGMTNVSFRFRLEDRGKRSALKMRLAGPMVRRSFLKSAARLNELLKRDGVVAG
jgi:hypothetical protein